MVYFYIYKMRMRKYGCLFLLLFISLASFAQNKKVHRDTSAKHYDSLVDYYETSAIKFYHIKKYDSAIVRFMKAKSYIDTLFEKRTISSDLINLLVTKCDLALCYSMKRKFNTAMQEIPEGGNWPKGGRKIVDWTEDVPTIKQYVDKIHAFINFTKGDCQVAWKDPLAASNNYATAYLRLKAGAVSDSVITYKYAIKTYINKSSFAKVFDYWYDGDRRDSLFHDSLSAVKCLNSLKGISQDK